ncbi:LacI family DNA-binding transcriptional regulator [Mycetocola zhadangensis]|uniref:LacI family transcriptional regulator n=1 Tax=Mycetocola zhadangensis TaxID=1164595 RepID=A0A3L7ITH5_9MICO|nr:LacI family DNA-binding transcriptional regulator [Mycetocola zhadangensis]RLQ81527.1 LacI family transcriptional regulator [Mycetocola zhadangensis]RLQ82481.1 LacI family transcriptional regulator [Mycetocola zhadangensis]GGF00941.1 LacI family transcriptional regulator [Mycetocola zhadangensis]
MAGVRLQDVAEHAGVSMKTVSNVVHSHPNVSAAMRERVQRAIDELGYRPNAIGRRLATGRTGLIALAFADVRLPYFSELANVISKAAAATGPGYRLLLEETEGTIEGERAVLSASEAGLVDGMLLQPSRMSSREIAERHGDLPMVLLGEGPAPLSVDRVMVDNVAAATAATEHLAALGRERVAFVGHERSGMSSTSRQRIMGYQEGLERHGLPVDHDLLISTGAITSQDAAIAVGAALDRGVRFDGLVCRDDLAAIGALRALHERDISIPDDVAVIGWDNIAFAATTFPSLSSVAPNTQALARVALDMLAERIAGFDGIGRHRVVDFDLVLRESAPALASTDAPGGELASVHAGSAHAISA